MNPPLLLIHRIGDVARDSLIRDTVECPNVRTGSKKSTDGMSGLNKIPNQIRTNEARGSSHKAFHVAANLAETVPASQATVMDRSI